QLYPELAFKARASARGITLRRSIIYSRAVTPSTSSVMPTTRATSCGKTGATGANQKGGPTDLTFRRAQLRCVKALSKTHTHAAVLWHGLRELSRGNADADHPLPSDRDDGQHCRRTAARPRSSTS